MADVTLPIVEEPALDRPKIARELRALIEGEVRFGRHERMLYATDASLFQVEPIGVVVPRHVRDVELVVSYCAEHRLPLLPRGGGTSLAGQAVARAIVVDLSAHVNRLIALDPERRTADVEPGLVLDDLNAAAAPHGLMFGPDVATSAHANLGGMIGNNSAGARSVLYGRTVEHLIGLDVLLASGERLRLDEAASSGDPRVGELVAAVAEVVLPLAGEIDRRFPKIRRHVDGYNLDIVLDQIRRSSPGTFDRVNLAHLLCGSEGTLGLTVGARLALVPRPAATGLALVAFPDLDAALRAVAPILEQQPSAVELIDEVVIEQALANREYRRYVELLPHPGGRVPAAVLYVEHFAGDGGELASRLAWLEREFGSASVVCLVEPGPMARAWKLRRAGEPLLHGMAGARKPVTFVEDLAVDPARLPEFVAEFRRIVEAHGTRAAYFAHASVGCLHIRPLVDPRDPADRETMAAIAREATDLVVRMGGALSGEHGDGRLRTPLLRRFYGEAICDAFSSIRAIFDPEGRLNPGNITDPGPMLEPLRVTPEPRGRAGVPAGMRPVRTFFRYEREGGFAEAVSLCNGAGVCRRTRGGTMCPSYRATRDERHATRGRGNALRLAVTGQLPGDGGAGPAWGDPETLRTLDLCLSCKACKAECPSNVDVARLRSEYLAQGWRAAGGVPRRVRRFGRVRRVQRLGSRFWWLANPLVRWAPLRRAADRVLGLDPRRSLPRFGRPLRAWWRATGGGDVPAGGPEVLLLADCFTTYGETHVGRAAIDALRGLGYRVRLLRTGCCGRALISTGMLEEAIGVCTATARRLLAHSGDAVPIVGCEPSCVSAITDDWPDLELPVPRAEIDALAERTLPVEHFIEARWDDHPRRPELARAGGGPVLLHGHCHEKALWGLERPAALLARLAGADLTVLDSGCCGMAGAFGYTADHYDLSMRIGELELFPAIRARPGALVLASGTSCRHQIRDALGVEARHPVEMLAGKLKAES